MLKCGNRRLMISCLKCCIVLKEMKINLLRSINCDEKTSRKVFHSMTNVCALPKDFLFQEIELNKLKCEARSEMFCS